MDKIERCKFFILELIKQEKDSLCYKDSNFEIARRDSTRPTWIWTEDKVSRETVNQIEKILEDKYFSSEKIKITSKKTLFDEMSKKYKIENSFEMAVSICKELKEVKKVPGYYRKAEQKDTIIVAEYYEQYCKEMFPNISITWEECLKEMEEAINEGRIYVWEDNKITAISCIQKLEDIVKISHVFTPKEKRNKGYCSSLIHDLTKYLLENSYQPMLYSDYHYKPSNKAYQKVGYEQIEILMNYSIRRID